MNVQEAQESLMLGHALTHPLFNQDEYIHMPDPEEDSLLFMSKNYSTRETTFSYFNKRKGYGWQHGWVRFFIPKKLFIVGGDYHATEYHSIDKDEYAVIRNKEGRLEVLSARGSDIEGMMRDVIVYSTNVNILPDRRYHLDKRHLNMKLKLYDPSIIDNPCNSIDTAWAVGYATRASEENMKLPDLDSAALLYAYNLMVTHFQVNAEEPFMKRMSKIINDLTRKDHWLITIDDSDKNNRRILNIE